MMDSDATEVHQGPPFVDRLNQNNRRFPKSSVRLLKRWITANAHDPRPTDAQKQYLQEQTGLTTQQISMWFANARRRGLHKATRPPAMYNLGSSASISVPNVEQMESKEGMHPFERWRNSPPENEPASLAAIADAVAGTDDTAAGNRLVGYPASPFMLDRPSRPLSETSFESMSSFWTSGSSSSAQSERSDFNSATSVGSAGGIGQKIRRRRHRSLNRHLPLLKKPQKEDQARKFQCTFCTDTFKTKYDWTRHESTLHLVLEKWTCAPLGSMYRSQAEDVARCVFCDEQSPSHSHILSHNYHTCHERPLVERSFRRKDHLRQHLRLVHSVSNTPLSMSQWKTTITQVKSRCGFCGEQFILWPERNEHLGDHFRDGVKMKDWKGDRGFGPAIALMVENAMPPYLIGTESNGFEPFSASRTVQKNTAGTVTERTGPTLFEDLTARLADYVRSALREGRLINDEMVKKQARLILFGDDDAWNQTPADNDEWLRLFKSGLGLGVASDPASTTLFPHQPLSPSTSTDHSNPQNQFVATSGAELPRYTNDQLNMLQLDTDLGLFAVYNPPSTTVPKSPLPWLLQTPECLAEIRQMEQAGHLPSVINEYLCAQPSTSDRTIDDLLAEMFPVEPASSGPPTQFDALANKTSLDPSRGLVSRSDVADGSMNLQSPPFGQEYGSFVEAGDLFTEGVDSVGQENAQWTFTNDIGFQYDVGSGSEWRDYDTGK